MILIVAASNGHNLDLAKQLQQQSRDMGFESEILDLTKVELPVYSPVKEAEGLPVAVEELHTRFREASGFFFCAPEYNGLIPPVLNNTIAWLSVQGKDFRALFNGKPLGLATHSGGGGQKVLTAMRIQMSHLGCNVIGREILTNKNKSLNLKSSESILRQITALCVSG
ncbi:MAG: NAD(P)H-dependent oxidoreductase [Myxococcota bacterium]|nr:NAD(P)H-dependent oxidoreductase [Myxococcota bacterium]